LEGDVVISNVMVTRAITERFFEKMSNATELDAAIVGAVHGAPRMGPIFGGMLLSGRKAARLILRDLDGEAPHPTDGELEPATEETAR